MSTMVGRFQGDCGIREYETIIRLRDEFGTFERMAKEMGLAKERVMRSYFVACVMTRTTPYTLKSRVARRVQDLILENREMTEAEIHSYIFAPLYRIMAGKI